MTNKNTPKINYEYLETPEGEESLNKAFDFLFEEVMRIEKEEKNDDTTSKV